MTGQGQRPGYNICLVPKLWLGSAVVLEVLLPDQEAPELKAVLAPVTARIEIVPGGGHPPPLASQVAPLVGS